MRVESHPVNGYPLVFVQWFIVTFKWRDCGGYFFRIGKRTRHQIVDRSDRTFLAGGIAGLGYKIIEIKRHVDPLWA